MISIEYLNGLDFFKNLSTEQMAKVASIASLKTFEKDAYVQKENEESEALFFVHSGRVDLQIDMPQNRKIVIFTVQPGGMFGWSAIVPPHEVTASSICVTDSELIEVHRDPFLELLENDIYMKAAVHEKISQIIGLRLRETRLQLFYLLGWG